jgi:hypothetical protein
MGSRLWLNNPTYNWLFSDRTWTKLGRRTLLLAGAILASAALFIIPNSPTLWFAAGMLWIMDASTFLWSHFVLLLAIIFRKTTYHGTCKVFYWDCAASNQNF